ncbi:hypothetical protein AcV5_008327 [Taiwanofungus camphoratus]|nr:hypothetical protein AcV5_008327 [Antrodia cinnamomea]KAI0955739.1 hypothetical protein AcV7_006319 [Antrodia cinnamomea]
MASAHSYSHPPPPQNVQDTLRLPSLKDLNFPYHSPPSQDGPHAPNGTEHGRPPRHDPSSWARSSSSVSVPTSQHQPSMSTPHQSPKSHQYSTQKPDGPYINNSMPPPQQPPSSMAGPNGSGPGAARVDAPSQNSMKRPRSGSGVGASPGRPHNAYPPHASYPSQPPPPSFQQGPPIAIPPSHEPMHQPVSFSRPPPGYAYPPPPPHLVQRHYAVPQPQQPPVHQHQNMPANSYPPPLPPQHWQHPSQPSPQHQYNGFTRTTALVPANVETRSSISAPADVEKATMRQGTIQEIVKHCNVLYNFANRYAQIQSTTPYVQPSPSELEEMTWHAQTVVRLLEDLRRLNVMDEVPKENVTLPLTVSEETTRPPKRIWEDISRDDEVNQPPSTFTDNQLAYPESGDKPQSTAEQDMEIIRSKRATSTGGGAPGQPKSKYRKRSRATPPGKCHSCNIRETPEWRRGPDGARTLCNACGLHYAKLMRKRDKGADGKAAPIDLQTLRASTASARGSDPEQSHPQSQIHRQSPGLVPGSYDHQKSLSAMHPLHHPAHAPHSSPYQLMPAGSSGPPPPSAQPHQMMLPPPPPATHGETGVNVPPPPWMTSSSSSSGRTGYTSDHQSYLRASHPPSHARASPQ